ncbi:glutamate--tRNA ligase [Bartonella sp. DGB1]|uniref:glutamate--tRNA ligase n=1 Tax=Bartonella sp. DGB1 TaxID=3239807 RepID=UPI0035247C5F
MIKVRFAPSPTGYIHIGNARAALFNWLYVLKNNGNFILRFDDTDSSRSKEEYITAIKEDLDWLQIEVSNFYFQSKRTKLYDDAVEQLKQKGLLYPCYETSEELERKRKLRLARKLPPIYGRDALKLTEQEKRDYESEGRKPHWRFLLPNFDKSPFDVRRTLIEWDDVVRGKQIVDMGSISDPVLVRADGSYLYTLPSVVDDIDMEITHIIRGDDHITNTGAQIPIFNALGAKAPAFGHFNLLTTDSGAGLSKRKGDLAIRNLRNAGFEPMAVASLAVLIGSSKNVVAYDDMKSLSEVISSQDTSRSTAQFSENDLPNLNRQLVHRYEFEQVKDRLAALNIEGEKAKLFWDNFKSNLTFVNEAKIWWEMLQANFDINVALSDDDKNYIKIALEYLPTGQWDNQTWFNWCDKLKQVTGRKGKNLFMPLRLTLTGQEHGPDLASILQLIGYQEAKNRLNNIINK